MWFKKKSVLQADGNYDTEKSADGTTDMRTIFKKYTNFSSSINSGLPSAADAGNYFYLPALGYYRPIEGQLSSVGSSGYYWSSTATPASGGDACYMNFGSGYVNVASGLRYYGMRSDGVFE